MKHLPSNGRLDFEALPVLLTPYIMETVKKILTLVAGWFFIVLGVIGLFLPFLQGILFIMIGLAILSSRSERVRRLVKHIEARFPRQHEAMEAWKKRVMDRFKRP